MSWCKYVNGWSWSAYVWGCQQPSASPTSTSVAATISSTRSVPVATSLSTGQNAVTTSSLSSLSSTSRVGSSSTSRSGQSSGTSSILTTSRSTAVSSIDLTETVPTITTATGTTSAVQPPASVTSSNALTSASTTSASGAAATGGVTVDQTILVLVRDGDSSYSVVSGLQGYGIPYQVVSVPKTDFNLPTLNSSATQGNYGGVISLSELSFEYETGWSSGVSVDQYNQIYAYQTAFGVRFVRIDAYPQPAFGTTPAPQGVGCCGDDVEQLISITNATGFSTANIKTDATMSTANMYHYPAAITDSSTTWEVAKFAPDGNGKFDTDTTAAVINDFGGRQQMVWFGSWATEWSSTSNFLQHSYIHWMTRGLFLGARKIYLSTQIDDVHLSTDVYYPQGKTFRLRPSDLEAHVSWMKAINGRLPSGSDYFIELGHNGNGDIISATNVSDTQCNPEDAIYYDFPPDTPMEFQKPLGSGTDKWPTTPKTYAWSLACAKLDELAAWFMTTANRDAYAHVSHTFTHLPQNNITYSDANKEIVFNQAWLKQVGIAAGKFSAKSLIPPAITGLHNGDAIRAWITNGIVNAVGDNSRPVLLSPYNQHWPLISNVSANGYAGLNIIPRECTLQEWKDTASGYGGFSDLLSFERRTTSRYLLGLRHDGYMFHQANLRQADAPTVTIGSQTGQFSLLQDWVETITQEMMRLTNWPMQSMTQDDLSQKFIDRMTRDNCNAKLSYTYSTNGKSIVAVTVTSNSNKCSTTVPVTFPGGAPSVSGTATSDKVGSEPLIMWAQLSGSAVKFTLPTPVVV